MKADALKASPAESRFRIGDLVRRSGMSRETIHYYMREGLLQEPEKTGRNTALYNEAHVRRLSLIRSLREEHLLSLKAIKGLLADQAQLSFTPDQLAVLQRLRRQTLSNRQRSESNTTHRSAAELADELNLTPTEMEALRSQHFLSADDHEIPDPDEIETLRLWALIRNAGLNGSRGFGPVDLGYINQAAEVLFNKEVELFRERLHDLSTAEIDALLHTVMPAINRLVSLRHERKIAALLEAYTVE